MSGKRLPSVHLALAGVQVMFASLSVAGKLVLPEMPARGIIALRVSLAALIFVAARLVTSPWEKVAPRDLVRLAVYSFFGIVANQLLFIEGLQRTTATNAVVIGAVIPVFTVGVAVAIGREKATWARLLGLALGLAGALYIAGAGKVDRGHAVGNALIVCNSLSFAIYLVISRPILARYQTVTVVTWTFVFAALGVVPFGASAAWTHLHMSAGAWYALGWIVLFPTVGTYFLNAFALKRAPSSLVAVYVYLQPVMGGLMAAAVLGERPAPTTLVGGLAIAAGIAVVTLF